MNNEHNPIAQLISQIQKKWFEEVTPFSHYKLIRWLIKPQETKLYEGFLHLEATPHGKLPEIFISLLTPFESIEKYSQDLIKTWIEIYDKDREIFNKMGMNAKKFEWRDIEFRKKITSEEVIKVSTFYEMVSSFSEALQIPDRKLTVALMPLSVKNLGEYKKWLLDLLKNGIGPRIQFCFFDYVDQRYFDDVINSDKDNITKNLIVPLDLDGAINKIMQSGDPNSPEVQLRKYIIKMSEAVTEKSLSKLDKWGQECIDVMTGSKIKSLMASAYIIYAGMLFNFRQYDKIDNLLNKGLKVAEAGKEQGDPACQALIMQYYGYLASNCQLKKKYKKAIEWYCGQAEVAIKSNLKLPAITAFRQAAYLSKRHDPLQYKGILKKGFSAGEGLNKEELAFSDFCFIGLEYYNILYENREIEISMEIDKKMTDLYGEHWKDQTAQKANLLQKKSSTFNQPEYVTS